MRGSSFRYLIKEGFRNIYQNRAISIAAIGVLMACLILVGISMLFTININNMVGYFESQNEIMVFLSDDVIGDELTDIDTEIRSISNVASMVRCLNGLLRIIRCKMLTALSLKIFQRCRRRLNWLAT